MKVNTGVPIKSTFGIKLADGSFFEIEATDMYASKIVSLLATTMRLNPERDRRKDCLSKAYTIYVQSFESSMADLEEPLFKVGSEDTNRIACSLSVSENSHTFALQLIFLSHIISDRVRKRGGALIHGALAECYGQGIIIAGQGGAGKTTASRRLNRPWRSLSDDAALVVFDDEGRYWAHPWPTWSSFSMPGGSGGIWNTQRALPLKAIFFLKQNERDALDPLGKGESAVLLQQCSAQLTLYASPPLSKKEMSALHLELFQNACSLVMRIPCYKLGASLNGAFWKKIEQALALHPKVTNG